MTSILDYGMSLQEAVEAPRFLWKEGKQVLMEEGFKGLEHLGELGHETICRKYPGKPGVAHCGIKKGRIATLSADMRGDRIPFGL